MRLAGEIMAAGMTCVSDLKQKIFQMVTQEKPMRILETGTYLGTGSTRAFVDAAISSGHSLQFHTIEVNEGHFELARKNLSDALLNFKCSFYMWNGLSVPASLIPSEIDVDFPESVITDSFDESFYHNEIVGFIQDDCISKAILAMGGFPDMILLDSAGHMGTIEFCHLMSLHDGITPFTLILDDTMHRKHYKTMELVRKDKSFKILHESESKFGFAIIQFKP
ncbi:MAG: hypothetical protein DWQ44_08960 [Bacteroidetes bacterium]|nr:MAG: hypothetical protein DWQ33_02815 [Bacteroidota bacterium]REK06419.1 MAG: hypothetical protein DWQ39_02750 [Bacteroidota bacterium]REK33185.1 MAG: hypothetical protein DWQ44_08960 [Bacteroidota bacterium]REK47021.1 MAG: hypothetical protein DWQ48_13290 [Bacteroidota bacterium]